MTEQTHNNYYNTLLNMYMDLVSTRLDKKSIIDDSAINQELDFIDQMLGLDWCRNYLFEQLKLKYGVK